MDRGGGINRFDAVGQRLMGNPLKAAPSANDDWRTPAKYVEMARRVMGSIDVDPASTDIAQEIVKAGKHYTKEDDGLLHTWHGNVWLNPPYSAAKVRKFAGKLLLQHQTRATKQAVVLTNAATDTQWFHMLLDNCNCFCLKIGRIAFTAPDGTKSVRPAHGSAFFYFGNNAAAFYSEFKKEGPILFPKESRDEIWDEGWNEGWGEAIGEAERCLETHLAK